MLNYYMSMLSLAGFVQVVESLESHGILVEVMESHGVESRLLRLSTLTPFLKLGPVSL